MPGLLDLGHKNVSTTMIYTHVLGRKGVRNLFDRGGGKRDGFNIAKITFQKVRAPGGVAWMLVFGHGRTEAGK